MPGFSVPIETSGSYDTDAIDSTELRLRYEMVPTGPQRITDGRLKAKPKIRLNDYRCTCVFDWVEVAVDVGSDVRASDVARSLNALLRDVSRGRAWVTGWDRQRDYHGRQLIVRLQDPTRQRLGKLLHCLGSTYRASRNPFERPDHRIVGLELAVDFYPIPQIDGRPRTDQELILLRARMSETLRRHFRYPAAFLDDEHYGMFNDWPREVTSRRPTGRKLIAQKPGPRPACQRHVPNLLVAACDPDRHKGADLDGTFYLGRRGSLISYRLQDKVTDRRDVSSFVQLPVKKRRSRIEVVLSKPERDSIDVLDALDVRTVGDLEAVNFSTLQQTFFKFWLPTVGKDATGALDAEEMKVLKQTGALGLDLYQRGMHETNRTASVASPAPLGPKGLCHAYSELNGRIERSMKKVAKHYVDA